MEKTLILKHISRMLCLLISYSKFTRTYDLGLFTAFVKLDIINKGNNLFQKRQRTFKRYRHTNKGSLE